MKHASSYFDAYRDNFPSTPRFPVPPVVTEMLQRNAQAGEVVVPQAKYFVLGDNRDNSADRRYWGFISKGDIIGRSGRFTPADCPSAGVIGPLQDRLT